MRSGIRDKHPGSATLLTTLLNLIHARLDLIHKIGRVGGGGLSQCDMVGKVDSASLLATGNRVRIQTSP
jgi:hypothetical protein